jgi:predicted O-methyltransferase YrrM
MINQVFRKKVDSKYINAFVSDLKSDQTDLKIEDYGAGSRKNNSAERKISNIYQSSSSNPKKADLIRRICEYEMDSFKFLELGTNLGVTTYTVSQSTKCTKLISIEGCPNLFEYTKSRLSPSRKIELINATFDQQLDSLLKKYEPTIVYIDGNHTYEATKTYFEKIAPFKSVELIIFDDINWSDDMFNAWSEIISSKDFKVSINLFKLGLLYRREGQRKEKFVIRY